MNEIICPNCNKAFTIDEAGYASILKQVHNKEFDHALSERLEIAAKEKEAAIKLTEAETKNELQNEIAQKDSELVELNAKNASLVVELNAEKNTEIAFLKSQIESADTEKKLAISEAVSKLEKERDTLTGELKIKEVEHQLLESSMKESFEVQLKSKDDEIAFHKDYKAKLSTKMVGESLEQHCEIEFNRLRATGFQNAIFEKDNAVVEGTKGDYIFREAAENGAEFISIMFEMKNQGDETSTKKKNEDFLSKLDEDRKKKGCEYAVLVSMLEADNELYNIGIFDVSHRFPKMYVIRPQFFIPIITLLRNAAASSLEYKTELALVRSQNIDITNFEDDVNKFKIGVAKNFELASRQFNSAIGEIDKTIDHLQKTKDALLSTLRQFRLSNSKADDLSIKRLIKGNPTMASKFEELKKIEEVD